MWIPMGYAQLSVFFSGNAVPLGAAVTVGVRNDAELEASGLAAAASSLWLDAFKTVDQPSGLNYANMRVKLGPNSTGQMYDTGPLRTGASSLPLASPNNAYLIRKITAAGGRKGRGRIYWPGVPEASVDASGNVSGAWANAIQASWAEFAIEMGEINLPLVLLHSYESSDVPPYEITGFTGDAKIASQRRRNRR